MRARRRGRSGSSGHALMELVVALPILAIGGAAVTGMVLSSGGLLLEAERRFEGAARGLELLDSLRTEAESRPATGTLEALGREMEWAWDGRSTLELTAVAGSGGAASGWSWTLRAGGWGESTDEEG